MMTEKGEQPLTIDLNGLSPEAALAKLREAFDATAEPSFARAELMLRDHGATDEELAAEIAHMRADCVVEREKFLAALLRSIDEPGAPPLLQ